MVTEFDHPYPPSVNHYFSYYQGRPVLSKDARSYGRAIDHPAIERVDGIRKVIFEPYESSCSMDTARRMAAELAIRLECDARVSLCSWHYPGLTIRITLAPSPTFVPVAPVSRDPNATPSQPDVASVGQRGPHGASATMALALYAEPPADGSSPEI